VGGFAACNVALTLVWIVLAVRILRLHDGMARLARAAAVAAVAVLLIGLASVPASAQDTREGELAAAQAEKATELHAYEPTTAERRIEMVKNSLTAPSSFYPFIGSVFPGGWLGVGPGYRARFAEGGTFDIHGAWSIKNYKTVDTALVPPSFANHRMQAEFRANWLDAPKVAFYGVGNDSSPAAHTSFLYRTTTIGGSLRVLPASFFAIGGGVDSIDVKTGAGTAGTSIEQRFTLADTAGLAASPSYIRSRAFAEIDWRESPGYTRSGGLYRVTWSDYHQRNTGPYSFRQLDAEADQFLPLLRENWVIALRALASTTYTDSGNAVPYFLMPDLGGSSRLRGYPAWRFRDRNRLLLTGEYRWMAGQFVDMAIFLDAGKVAPTRSDLDLTKLKTSYGVGIRFHMPSATLLRMEVARTAEGTSLVFGFGPVF
jgi:hypothetical protein